MPYENVPKAPIAAPAPEEDTSSGGNTSTADTVVLHLSDQDCSVSIPAPVALLGQEPNLPNLNQTDESQPEATQEEQPMSSEAEGSAAGGKGAPKKRKRVTKVTVLNEDVERQLGEWLEHEATFIYDKKDPKHTNKDLVSATWASKAQSLTPPLTMEELKKWFDSIRTRYGKLSAGGKSGQGAIQPTEREKWILNTFAFLRSHIVRQRKTRTCGLQTPAVS